MKKISRIPDSEQKSTCIELFAKHRWIISDWVIECWCRGRNYLVVWNWWSCNTTELLATNTPRTWLSTKLTTLNIRCAWALANQVRCITWKRILLALLINLVAKQRWFDTALNWAWTGTQVRSIKSTAGDRRRLTNAVAGAAVSTRDQTKQKNIIHGIPILIRISMNNQNCKNISNLNYNYIGRPLSPFQFNLNSTPRKTKTFKSHWARSYAYLHNHIPGVL